MGVRDERSEEPISNGVLGPLPDPSDMGYARLGYTADDMRAYAINAVAAERERCAKLCEWLPIGSGESGWLMADVGHYSECGAKKPNR